MRKLVLLLALCCGVAGCDPAVTFERPGESATVTCPSSPLADINPWSKYHMCLESYVAEGYQRVR
jgi:hypothetical protein